MLVFGNGFKLTTKGKQMVSSGASYSFSKIVLGAGTYTSAEDATTRTALKAQKQSFDVSDTAIDGSIVTIAGVITNASLAVGYTITEAGVIAKDSTGAEHLFLIGVATLSDPMPAHSDNIPDVICDMKIKYTTSNTSKVSLSVPETAYARAVDLKAVNSQLAQNANYAEANYAKKTEVTNVMTPKGTIAYASLPVSGNEVGWYYYCPDGDGTNGSGNYVWNGTVWYFGGTGDQGYNVLKKDLVKKEDGNIIGTLVADSYINTNGVVEDYAGWSRTKYIDVSEISILKITAPVLIRYGAWIAEDKQSVILPIVGLGSGGVQHVVPFGAKYIVISSQNENMKKVSIEVIKTKRETLLNDYEYLSNGKKRINIPYASRSYVDTIGNLQRGDNWMASEFIEIPSEHIYCMTTSSGENSNWNAFYDKDKNFLSRFDLVSGIIRTPDNAKYFRISHKDSDEVNFYEVKPTKIKVCSFNVGLWTDGVSSNARVADEDVPVESAKLRRFIAEANMDFMLCQEATHEFDKSYTIDAYDYCVKNNLPYCWKTSSSDMSVQVRQFLLAGKYELKNTTYHDYTCESTRGYVIFEVEIDGKTINFIVCHLSIEGNSEGIRQSEMEELSRVLSTFKYGILTGDFNAFSIDEFTTHFPDFSLANHGYLGDFNTWPVKGWETWNHCLDNIITTSNIKITNVKMGDVDMSDHKPLIADLEIY